MELLSLIWKKNCDLIPTYLLIYCWSLMNALITRCVLNSKSVQLFRYLKRAIFDTVLLFWLLEKLSIYNLVTMLLDFSSYRPVHCRSLEWKYYAFFSQTFKRPAIVINSKCQIKYNIIDTVVGGWCWKKGIDDDRW